MSARFKPGELAVTVNPSGSETGNRNVGRIVTVVEYVGYWEFPCGTKRPTVWICDLGGATAIDANGRVWAGRVRIDERNLRPIRDNDGEDETLAWREKATT